MFKYLLLLFCILLGASCFSQQMTISGSIQDTAVNRPLPNSVAMVIRLKDSVLVAFTRSDDKGDFSLSNLKIDTLELIVSNARFGDRSYYIIGSAVNTTFNLGTVVLPPKNKDLKEVVIYAFKDPVYYKGDTLMYTADSFKVKPNATVEDLLKKLPGIKVDQNGKVTSQGKAIDQVLVDGDEFFGTDPTIATRNLGAHTVESVQVYEKKDETNGSGENLQVMNLKLKDDAKKGYFGKASAATDFHKFYEGELFANKFKGAQKISIFGLISNTPKTNLGFGDINKYGLDNETDWSGMQEDGFMFYKPGEEPVGVPRSIKSGVYYTDRISKRTKLNMNYTYASNKLNATASSSSQYFLTDSSYMTSAESKNIQNAESNSINMKVVQTLDSLTELEIEPRLKLSNNKLTNQVITSFYTLPDSVMTHQSDVSNTANTNGVALNAFARLTRKFRKKDRKFRMNYNFLLNDNETNGINTGLDTLIHKDVNQQKNNTVTNQTHNALFIYTEPLSKKIKLEAEYNLNYNLSRQDKTTKDFENGEYTAINELLTNRFENQRIYNSLGAKFIYEDKHQSLNIGTRGRSISFVNTNLITGKKLTYSVNNLLPYLFYNYRLSDNSRLNFRYNTLSNQPTIDQLQPVPDNTNPIQVKLGNPHLKPTYSHNFNMFYNTFKPLSGFYGGAATTFVITDQAFTNAITYDSNGYTYTETVNVNGNYNASANAWAGIPLFTKKLYIEPSTIFSYTKNSNFINYEKNITKTANLSGSLSISAEFDTLGFKLGYTYGYNDPSSSLNQASNKPYSNQHFNLDMYVKLPLKSWIETSAQYIVNSNRPQGYNTNYVVWNLTINKSFLKTENLVLSLIGYDLLNQNINNNRVVQDNVITDTKTTVINRYFMIQLVYKFNNNNTKYEDF